MSLCQAKLILLKQKRKQTWIFVFLNQQFHQQEKNIKNSVFFMFFLFFLFKSKF